MLPSNHGQYIGDEDGSRSAFVSVYFGKSAGKKRDF